MILRHSVVVYPASLVVVSQRVHRVTRAAGSSVALKCQITPEKQTTMLDTFNVNLNRPHTMHTDIKDRGKAKYGDWVYMESQQRLFLVAANPAVFDHGTIVNGVMYALEELDAIITEGELEVR